jgi:hypothetical protein
MSFMNLDTCSMLVEVNIGSWTARKLDKSATEEVVHNKNAASKDAARVNKSLFAGRTELKEIESMAAEVRHFVDDNTMPWSNSGIRLLPTARFLVFDAQIKVYEQKFYDMVQDFLHLYPTLITAQAMALGDMFNRDDFPLPETLGSKFTFSVGYMPVPSSGDFRVDVGLEAQEELRAALDREKDKRIAAIKGQFVEQMGEQLKRMSYILGGVFKSKDKNGNEIVKTRAVYPSLMDDAWNLVEMIKAFNVDDPAIVEATRMLEQAINGVDLKDLKNPQIKQDVKKEVDAILNRFSF